MTHLGSRISALADGQLSPAQTDDAMAHVAACDRCANELRQACAARDLLVSTAWTSPPPDPALTSRLLAMRAVPPVPPGDPFAGPRQPQVLRLYGNVGTGAALGSRAPVWVAGSLASFALVVTVLFLLGAGADVVPADYSGRVPVTLLSDSPEPAAASAELTALSTRGWVMPDSLPAGWVVTATGVDGGVLEIHLDGPDGAVVVVTERHGVLNREMAQALPTLDVGGRTVGVVSYEPWTVVWQAGDIVVAVVAVDGAAAEALVAAFPAGAYDNGVSARVSRGWTALATKLH
ncbi:MAG: zf-HC2 domain-containing protein [Micrococcales bacterium]|nr:zf-HC2 domain-containing protein [Micrococcales bacterium]MCL2666196.1 zf-HC2 domain-containing protein [Micrococcales bacterium]